jgi:hypothetical protein
MGLSILMFKKCLEYLSSYKENAIKEMWLKQILMLKIMAVEVLFLKAGMK